MGKKFKKIKAFSQHVWQIHCIYYNFKTLFGIDVTNNSDSQHFMYHTSTKRVFNTETENTALRSSMPIDSGDLEVHAKPGRF